MPKTTVPGFTTNPRDAKGWCHGHPQSTWDGKVGSKTKLFVAEGMKDLWRISQELQGAGLGSELAVLTSTHGSGIPEEWKDPEFWAPWDEVYLGQDADAAGQTMAQTCRRLAMRDVRRVRPPGKDGADWTDFFQTGGTLEAFEALLAAAPRLEHRLEEAKPDRPLDADADGEYAIERININGAFKKGQLYYPFRVRRTETIEVFESLPDGRRLKVPRKTHMLVTQIVRSDGDVLTPREMPAPPGTPDEDKIIALEDGTIITSIPRPEDFATWRTDSITAYIAAVSAGQGAAPAVRRDHGRSPRPPALDRLAAFRPRLRAHGRLRGDELRLQRLRRDPDAADERREGVGQVDDGRGDRRPQLQRPRPRRRLREGDDPVRGHGARASRPRRPREGGTAARAPGRGRVQRHQPDPEGLLQQEDRGEDGRRLRTATTSASSSTGRRSSPTSPDSIPSTRAGPTRSTAGRCRSMS
jgi:hypothetical protein